MRSRVLTPPTASVHSHFAQACEAEFTDIASSARLSHKFDMDEILDEATKRTYLSSLTFSPYGTITVLSAAHPSDLIEAINLFRAL